MKVLILSDTDALEQQLRAAMGEDFGGDIETVALARGARARPGSVAVAVIDGSVDRSGALKIAQEFDARRPGVAVVLYAEADDDLAARAMQIGVRDVLRPGADDDRIREAVKWALEVADRRQHALGIEDKRSTERRLIMVVSPKGGAGKTTVATNLAVGLAHRAPREVVLVDGDLQFGDVANSLRLHAETTVRDAISGGLHDVTEVKVHLLPHSSGLYALCAPEVPGIADEITPQAFSRAVGMLSNEFRFVIVDTDPGLGERTLAVMDNATDLVFVAATDVASVRGLHKTIDALDRIGMNSARRHFLLNRSDAKVGLDVGDIAVTIGMTPDVMLPSSRSVPISMNRGTPLLDTDLESPASAPLWQLVDRFLPDPNASEPVPEARPKRAGGRLRRR